MKDTIIKVTVGIIILVLVFFLGRCTDTKEVKTIEVKIPEISGSSSVIIKPTPLPYRKDSISYKESIVYTEGEYNKKLAQDYLDLEKRYTDIDLEKERLKKYLESIQIKDYVIPYEDDFVKITNNIKSQGEVLSFQQDYTIKERDIKVDVPVKTKINLYAGAEIGAPLKLDNIEIKSVVFKGNLMLQNKKGDILSASYDTEQRVWVGYAFKF